LLRIGEKKERGKKKKRNSRLSSSMKPGREGASPAAKGEKRETFCSVKEGEMGKGWERGSLFSQKKGKKKEGEKGEKKDLLGCNYLRGGGGGKKRGR